MGWAIQPELIKESITSLKGWLIDDQRWSLDHTARISDARLNLLYDGKGITITGGGL
jgi:hypothetical protein